MVLFKNNQEYGKTYAEPKFHIGLCLIFYSHIVFADDLNY